MFVSCSTRGLLNFLDLFFVVWCRDINCSAADFGVLQTLVIIFLVSLFTQRSLHSLKPTEQYVHLMALRNTLTLIRLVLLQPYCLLPTGFSSKNGQDSRRSRFRDRRRREAIRHAICLGISSTLPSYDYRRATGIRKEETFSSGALCAARDRSIHVSISISISIIIPLFVSISPSFCSRFATEK